MATISVKLVFGTSYVNTTIATNVSTKNLFESMISKYPFTKLRDLTFTYGHDSPAIIVFKESTCKKCSNEEYDLSGDRVVKVLLKPTNCTIQDVMSMDYIEKYKMISEGDFITFTFLDVCPSYLPRYVSPASEKESSMWLKTLSEIKNAQ